MRIIRDIFISIIFFASFSVKAEEAHLFTWVDQDDIPFIQHYIDKYGEEPKTSVFEDEDEAFAKLRAGYSADVYGPCSYEIPRWRDAGLIQPIDVSKLEYWEKIPESLRNMPGVYDDQGQVWFVPHLFGNTSVIVNTKLAPEYAGDKNSWDILWDPKYKGRIGILAGAVDTIPLVAAHIGINAYDMSDSEWETVKDKLRELVDQARIITNVTGELESAMAQGEVVAVEAWNDSYNNLIWDEQFTDSVEYMQPKDQKIFSWVCGFALSSTAGKDAPMEKAYALIDSGLSIGAAQFLIEDWGYAPANADGFSVASEEALELIIVDTSDVDAWLANTIFQEVMPNLDKIVEEWELIRAKVY